MAVAVAAGIFLAAQAALLIRVWRDWSRSVASDATRRALGESIWCLVPLLTLGGLLVVLP